MREKSQQIMVKFYEKTYTPNTMQKKKKALINKNQSYVNLRHNLHLQNEIIINSNRPNTKRGDREINIP